MYDFQGVDLVYSLTDLTHDEGDSRLREGLWLLKLVVELSPSAHLQNNVYIRSIVEAAIHFDDVGVVEEHLDLDLADELVGYFFLM